MALVEQKMIIVTSLVSKRKKPPSLKIASGKVVTSRYGFKKFITLRILLKQIAECGYYQERYVHRKLGEALRTLVGEKEYQLGGLAP